MGKTTNKLLAIAEIACNGERETALVLVEELRALHLREGSELIGKGRLHADLEATVNSLFDELEELLKGISVLGELTPRATDAVSAYGERLSSAICALAFEELGIPSIHIDARDIIVTDGRHTQANPLLPQTYSRVEATVPPLAAERVVVMGGFIGATEHGITSTLGRGGSDFTAAMVGAAIDADEIQIWTDVDGMLTVDPTVMPGGHRVEDDILRGGFRARVLRCEVLHPFHRAACNRKEYSRPDTQFAASRCRWHFGSCAKRFPAPTSRSRSRARRGLRS